MASRGDKMGVVTDFLLLGFLLASCLLLASWQERYDKHRQCVENQRRYSADKVHIVKAVVFPVVTYGCESWTIKKVEQQGIDAFELQCWRRLLKVTGQQGDQASQSGKTAGEAETSEFWSSDEN